MDRSFAGVDPGLGGAVALMHPDGVIEIFPTPTLPSGKGSRRVYDVKSMKDILDGHDNLYITLEKQGPMPAQGTVSTFSIGRGFGLWEGIIVGLGYAYTIVHPRTWKKVMIVDVPGVDIKTKSVLVAQRLFPDVNLKRTERCKKASPDFAEALLLAEYGRRMVK